MGCHFGLTLNGSIGSAFFHWSGLYYIKMTQHNRRWVEFDSILDLKIWPGSDPHNTWKERPSILWAVGFNLKLIFKFKVEKKKRKHNYCEISEESKFAHGVSVHRSFKIRQVLIQQTKKCLWVLSKVTHGINRSGP